MTAGDGYAFLGVMNSYIHETVSQTVHAVVQRARSSARSLNVHRSAQDIAVLHGIDDRGIWLVEQALLMVGSRAGVSMKIGDNSPPPANLPPSRAANSN